VAGEVAGDAGTRLVSCDDRAVGPAGARVTELSPARVDELYEYRTILEVGSLRIGMAQHHPLTVIEDATAALVALPPDTPWPEVIYTHQEIHA
jgi:DNA-binding GntR family transcriptional regulator